MPQGFFYGDLPPTLQTSYENDPRNAIAQQLLKGGTSQTPLRGGATEGILRLANALLGGYNQRKLGQEYQQKGTDYNTALASALQGIKPGHYDPQTGQYVDTDSSGFDAVVAQHPELSSLAQKFQIAKLQAGYSTDADVAGARAKSQYADWRDPAYQALELKKAELAGGRSLLGPAVTLYAETGDPTLLNSVLGRGGIPQQIPQGGPSVTSPQGQIPSTQGGGLPIAPLPPTTGPSPQSLQGPGAGLDSGGGLPFMPPKNVREATGKAQSDSVQNAIKSGDNAQIFLQKTPIYDEAINKTRYTGPGANLVMGARQIGHSVAPSLVEGAAPEEMVNELNTALTLSSNFDADGKRAFAGNFSDADRNFISQAQAGLSGSKEGLAYKYELAKAVKKREAEVGVLAQRFVNDPGGFESARRQLLSQPIVDDSLRQRVAALIGKDKPQFTGENPLAPKTQGSPSSAPSWLPPGFKIIEQSP